MAHSKRMPVIAGNWKMYKTVGEAVSFVEALGDLVKGAPTLPQLVVCPPFTALSPAVAAVRRLAIPLVVAAQTMESRVEGAYTGEISPKMLKDIDVSWVVLGHSERRQYYGETDATVHQKTKVALDHAMTPIVCVGETLDQREDGETDRVIEQQVLAVLDGLTPPQVAQLIFAYEPVWAIGTGKVCEASEANRVCGWIRSIVARVSTHDTAQQVRILYGGSVKPDNAQELLAYEDIDGALIGGASLDPKSFWSIAVHAPVPQMVP